MKIPLKAVLTCHLLFIALCGLSLAIAGAFYASAPVSREFIGVFTVLIFAAAFVLWSMIFNRLLSYISPLRPGRYCVSEVGTNWILMTFLNLFNNNLLVFTGLLPSLARPLFYRALGSKIGRDAQIAGMLIDPTLVELGNEVILGQNSIISCHTGDGKEASIGRVKIGSRVTIGGLSVIMPDVSIGEGSVVAVASVVVKGTVIPPGELWGGVPARRLRSSSSKLKHCA